jgi:hypothetical protein
MSVPSTEKCSSDSSRPARASSSLGNVAAQQPLPILREHGHIPHLVVHAQSDEPAEEKIVLELLHQQPLAAHRVENLKQERAKQLLRGNRRSARLGVELGEPSRELPQHLVGSRIGRNGWWAGIRCSGET